MADGAPSSPTSFSLGDILKPAADVCTTARDALTALAEKPYITEGFRLALKRQVADLDHQEREAVRYRGVCPSGLGPDYREPATLDALKAEGAEWDARFDAHRASPVGKARRVIAKGCALAHEINAPQVYQAFEDVAAALSRGDGSAGRKVEALKTLLAQTAELQVIATELGVYVAEVGREAA